MTKDKGKIAREEVLLRQPDLMCRIFSFLGGPKQTLKHVGTATQPIKVFADLGEAGRLYVSLSLVCAAWKNVCDAHLSTIMGPLEIQTKHLNSCCLFEQAQEQRQGLKIRGKCILAKDCLNLKEWFGKFSSPLKIGCFRVEPLKFGLLQLEELKFKRQIEFLLEMFNYCNTQDLKKIQVAFGACCDNPNVIRNERDLFETGLLLGNFFVFHKKDMSILLPKLYEILSESPVLEDLSIPIDLSGTDTMTRQKQYEDLITNSPLFSKTNTTLQRLDLAFWDIAGNFAPVWSEADLSQRPFRLNPGQLMASFPALTHLTLAGYTEGFWRSPQELSIQISSKTLRVLDVIGLKHRLVFCKDCPLLEQYNCNVSNRTGSLPDITTQDHYERLWDQFGGINTARLPGSLRFLQAKAGDLAFVGVDVPDSCTITVDHWGKWGIISEGAADGFDKFLVRLRMVQEALRCSLASEYDSAL